eukprot:12908496-Prorocentrum_lima.AAC.1
MPYLDKYGELLYSVSPRITEARALYRPGDDPSVESQASTHRMVFLWNQEGPRRPKSKRLQNGPKNLLKKSSTL